MTSWNRGTDIITEVNRLKRKDRKRRLEYDYDPTNRPGPVPNVQHDFKVREKEHELRFTQKVRWDPLAPGTCEADIALYVVEVRPTNANGVPKDAGRKLREIVYINNIQDLEPDVLHAVFPVSHPKHWYWQARVRVVDKDTRQGKWSEWTKPKLPFTEANPGPPPPTGIRMDFDKERKQRHEPRWNVHLACDELGYWDIPPKDPEPDYVDGWWVSEDRKSRLAEDVNDTEVLLKVDDVGKFPSAPFYVLVNELERMKVTAKESNNRLRVERGIGKTTKTFHSENEMVKLSEPKSDDQGPRTDIRAYIFQIRRCDSTGAFVKNAKGEYIQRTRTKPAKNEDEDNNSIVTCRFTGVRKKNRWRARVRSMDVFNRRGDWSDWTVIGTPLDTDKPPRPLHPVTGQPGCDVEVENHRVVVRWVAPRDAEDEDAEEKQVDPEIAFFQVQISEQSDFSPKVDNDPYVPGERVSFKVKKPANNYYARVRSVDGSGNKSDWSRSDVGSHRRPPKPDTPPVVNIDAVERKRHNKWRAIVRPNYNEFNYNEDRIDRYFVQFQVSKTNTTFTDADNKRGQVIHADDTPLTAIFHNLKGRWWVRARFRAVDKANRKSDYSNWSTPEQVRMNDKPTRPSGVRKHRAGRRVGIKWDPPIDPITTMVDESVSHYHVQLSTSSLFTTIVEDDEPVVANAVRYPVPNTSTRYHVRVASVDEEGNHSDWVYPGEQTGEPQVADDLVPGSIRPGHFDHDFSSPIEKVAALPTTGLYEGRVVYLTSNGKMYRYYATAKVVNGVTYTGWQTYTDGSDLLVGSVTTGALATDSVTTSKLDAQAITAKHTITGPIIRTAATGARVVMKDIAGENDRIKWYGSGGNIVGYAQAQGGGVWMGGKWILANSLRLGDAGLTSPSPGVTEGAAEAIPGSGGSNPAQWLKFEGPVNQIFWVPAFN